MVPEVANEGTGFILKGQKLEILASVLNVTALFNDFMSKAVTLLLVPVYVFVAGGSF
jgi:hypothetical protein